MTILELVPPATGVLGGIVGPFDGELLAATLVAFGALLVGFGVFLWAARAARRTTAVLRCPDSGDLARVDILLDHDGRPAGVRECSLLGPHPRCDRRCLAAS